VGGITPGTHGAGLGNSRKYSTSSLYKIMTSGGLRDSQMMTVWKCNIHLKVKIFIWMAVHDRIQSGVQWKKKQWSSLEECATCDKLKTSRPYTFPMPHGYLLVGLS
jgi:hypothetical protein